MINANLSKNKMSNNKKINIDFVNSVLDVLQQCSNIAMSHYHDCKINVDTKSDNSPVTIADKEINTLICNFIKNKLRSYLSSFYKILIISEEDSNCLITNKFNNTGDKITFFIDPIDGTRSFIKKNAHFTINIGVCINKIPVIGFIVAPAFSKCYFGLIKNKKYTKYIDYDVLQSGCLMCGNFNDIKNVNLTHFTKLKNTNSRKKNNIILTISNNPKEAFILEKLKHNKVDISNVLYVSSSFKGCLLAENKADIYYRNGETFEWDTAAMDAIVRSCKYIVRDLSGKKLKYEKENYKNKDGFCIINNPSLFVKLK